MIVFQKVKFCNFLSTGNNPTEIILNEHDTTLVVGKNGAGKSTMLDAISFALFGKPYRNINKPQLVNSINNRACEVELEFTVGKHYFKVIRGIKPTKFEIWQNGEMINQDSNSRDHQKHLERNILKLNHKSFHQIVVLGSASYVPFMQLPAAQRREVIEDLLDINVFSKMNQILKEKVQGNKEQIKTCDSNIELIKEKIKLQRKHIREISEINKSVKEEKEKEITESKEEVKSLREQVKSILSTNDSKELTNTFKQYNDELLQIKQEKSGYESSVKLLVKEAKFYDNNDSCPTCSQDLSPEFKESRLVEIKDKASNLQNQINEIKNNQSDIETKIIAVSDELEKVKKAHDEINRLEGNILSIENRIHKLQKELSALIDNESDTSQASTELEEYQQEQDELIDQKFKLNEERLYLEVCSSLLKDSGIKTKIIKSYLPVMNQLINKYLQTLDFFVEFNLDEAFNETIKSRYRDHFTYASFSEGEKMKINLSLLFAWRQIARMKNSVASNLLIMDETFDSSLDQDGVDNLLKILDTVEVDTNVFVISHKSDVLDGKFRNKIEFEKVKNFSVMKNEK